MNKRSEKLSEVLHIRITETQRMRLERLAGALAVRPTDAARVAIGQGLRVLEAEPAPVEVKRGED